MFFKIAVGFDLIVFALPVLFRAFSFRIPDVYHNCNINKDRFKQHIPGPKN